MPDLKEIKCAGCGKFVGYEAIKDGLIIIRCHGCKAETMVTTLPEGMRVTATGRPARCGNCGRFLYSEAIVLGTVKVKCRGCHEWNVLQIEESLDRTSRTGLSSNYRSTSPASPRQAPVRASDPSGI